jgi:hypothetical protein
MLAAQAALQVAFERACGRAIEPSQLADHETLKIVVAGQR